jgi:uncharacterized repeat protein (TIGR03806 family)
MRSSTGLLLLAGAMLACSSSKGGALDSGAAPSDGGPTGQSGAGGGTGGGAAGTGGAAAMAGAGGGSAGVTGTGGTAAGGATATAGAGGSGVGTIVPFGIDKRVANPTCKAPPRPPVIPLGTYVPQPMFPNLSTGNGGIGSTTSPIAVRRVRLPTNQPDPANAGKVLPGAYHWMMALRSGRIFAVEDANASAPPTANFRAPQYTNDLSMGEGGFLGLAFDPDIASDPTRNHVYFVTATYADYSLKRATVVTTPNGSGGYTYSTTNEVLVLRASSSSHHHGGEVMFGPDGFLYFSTGEGDVGARTQSPRNLRGKILRIDVHSKSLTATYGIPASNAWRLDGANQPNAACSETGENAADQTHDCPEVYAVGFRNPFRFSFDKLGGALWVGDVGAAHEEIDIVEGGKNYGWNTYEGATPTNDPKFVPSVAEIPRTGCTGYGYAIVGGFVYRGTAIPSLVGKYVVGDNDSGKLFVVEDPYGGRTVKPVFNNTCTVADFHPASFTEDENGELYVVSLTPAAGRGFFKIVAATAEPSPVTGSGPPMKLADTGCVVAGGTPIAAAIPYDVNVELWSDGLSKRRWLLLPDNQTITIGDKGHLILPVGSVVLKEFFTGTRRIETRLLVRHSDGDWAGYTYLWNAAQTEALLQDPAVNVALPDGGAAWGVPSRVQCLACHTTSRQRTLGLELRQLDRDFTYALGTANQLATLSHIGVLPAMTPATPAYPAAFGTAPLDERARAYLDVNCASCHPAPGNKPNLLFDTPAAERLICNETPTTAVDGGTRLLVPGNAAASIMHLRMSSLSSTRMPALGSRRVDTQGLQLIDTWINQKTACP